MPSPIYLDHAATTPLDPRVLDAMLPALDDRFGNPSSPHAAGRAARSLVDRARKETASLLRADPDEVVFTGSGTEANSLALYGVFGSSPRGHLVTSAIEHPSVLEVSRDLERRGVAVSYLAPDSEGIVRPDALAAALRPDTQLVSIMSANNVAGTIQPIAALGQLARAAGALFHTDAVQAVGKLPFSLRDQPIDLLSMCAHKLHGPKGVGALYARRGVELVPFVRGGGQERGLRSGTENTAAIVGFGAAARIACDEGAEECARQVGLRDRIIDEILASVPSAYVVGHRHMRLPGHVCMAFSGLETDSIRLQLLLDDEGICVSTGSACSAHQGDKPSHVLVAMGFDPIRARGALRITLGRFTTIADVERLLGVLPRAIQRLAPATSGAGRHNASPKTAERNR
jgi:cysteine desulfurase